MPDPSSPISYKSAGVDIDNADATKKAMATSLETKSPLVLNAFGAFASLLDGSFKGYKEPVLVCKTEEPGSKQLIAFQHDKIESVCEDLINHLINDIIVMGATPVFFQDCIICGKLESDKVKRIVKGMADACRAQDCILTGGETSEQPGVIPAGTYILTSSGIGVAEKSKVIDGSAIKKGDRVLAVASSGLHTNGYTLVRKLMEAKPEILKETIDGKSFIDTVVIPHRCYWKPLKDLMKQPSLHGMAHITGGGIEGNLNRILPKNLDASIDASAIKILPIFKVIKKYSGSTDVDMRRTYNLGAGMTIVVSADAVAETIRHFESLKIDTYAIGEIVDGNGEVEMKGELKW